ncbi:phage regulatory protein Rha, partial [Enterococcus faecalis]|uniref:Rha family transcriptional regulator n=1 Tax=Enterococcus faecalis TaxID=1351 RepID=UPI00035319D1
KQSYRQVIMNRDGFTLLAMGFTGQKALQFKLKYIEAFNQMEKEIQQPKLPTSQRELAMLALSANEETNERVDVIEKEVADLKDNQKIGADDYGYLSGIAIMILVAKAAVSYFVYSNDITSSDLVYFLSCSFILGLGLYLGGSSV